MNHPYLLPEQALWTDDYRDMNATYKGRHDPENAPDQEDADGDADADSEHD